MFDRYVRKLNDEAEARKVPVVTREGFAPYRIKGYASVWTRGRQATMSWVWEVFDSNGERVHPHQRRRKGRDAPAAMPGRRVNDDVLARAARSGMEQLSVYFRGPDSQTAVVASSAPEPGTDLRCQHPSRPSVAGGRVASAASLR